MSNIGADFSIEPEFNEQPEFCKTKDSTLILIKNEKPSVETIHGSDKRSEELTQSSVVYTMLNKIKKELKEEETREDWNIKQQQIYIKTEIKSEPERWEEEPSADLFRPEIIYFKSEKADKDNFLSEEGDQRCEKESYCTVQASCSNTVRENMCSFMSCDDPNLQYYGFPTMEDLSKNGVHNSEKKLSSWKCQYKDCEVKKGDVGLKFYRFPCRDPKRFKQWIINCGNLALFDHEEKKVKNFGICEKHFEEKDFINKSHHRLTCIAVPKHFLTGQSTYRAVQPLPRINTQSTLSQSPPNHATLSESTPIYFTINQSSPIHFTPTQSTPTRCVLNQSRPTHFKVSRYTSNHVRPLLPDLTVIKPKYTYSSIRKKHSNAHTESEAPSLKSHQAVPDVP